MIDSTTKQPIRVQDEDAQLPSIVLPASQLEELSRLLRTNGVKFWVDRQRISFNGLPPVAYVNIASGTDPARVQALLDTVA